MATISHTYETYDERPPALLVWLVRLPLLIIIGLTLLSVIFIMLIGAFRHSYAERITPGVTVLGADLSGLTPAQAVNMLNGRFTYHNDTVFTFRDGDRAWQRTAAQLGLSFDANATVEQAMAVSGNGGDLLSGLMRQADAYMNGRAIAPIIHYDQNMARAELVGIASGIDRPSQDAALIIDDDMSISAVPGESGRTVDIDATLNHLNSALLSLSGGGEISLVIRETQPAVWNMQEAVDRIQTAITAPIILTATAENGDFLGPWTINPAQIAALVQLRQETQPDGTRTYAVEVDMSGFRPALEALAPGLRTMPKDGRFRFDETTRQLVAIQPPQLGRALDIDATLARIQDAVFRHDARDVAMVFTYVQPEYHAGLTAAELGITELIGEATTYYHGSDANRRHNIAEGAARLDGIIIPPGGEFSFNDWVGEISYESGFKDGLVIVGGGTVNGVGGGICQVSTTIFRAALDGGYWITERNTHAYRVHYYELNGQWTGLDAAIWSPDRDFKFLNDTPYHILIQTSIFPNESALQFRIYSTSTGRQVELVEPQIRDLVPAPTTRFVANPELSPGEERQVEMAADGMDVIVVRRVTEPDGRTRTDRVFTHYLPWAAVFEVAPGDPRLSQSGG